MTRAVCTVAGVLAGAIAVYVPVMLLFAAMALATTGTLTHALVRHGGWASWAAGALMVCFYAGIPIGAIAGGVLGWRWARPEPCAGPAVETGTVVRREV